MKPIFTHSYHAKLNATFGEIAGQEVILDYGDSSREYTALRKTAGLIDLSFRGRLCLTGSDRQRFLNGQVTNDVNGLKVGEGCYSVLVTAKGKMISDLNIYCLEQEILLDFEPGLVERVRERLEKYIIADDVQLADVSPEYGLWSVQGPHADQVIKLSELGIDLPSNELAFRSRVHEKYGELYLIRRERLSGYGFDLFAPAENFESLSLVLDQALEAMGGCLCGWRAMETVRIEMGIPRFGIDMNESNLAPEAGLESRAISYSKGCYTGQEVIARIRTYGQVARSLRGFCLMDRATDLPSPGDKLYHSEREVGYVTSSVESSAFNAKIALGYVHRDFNRIGSELELHTRSGTARMRVVELPFSNAGIGVKCG